MPNNFLSSNHIASYNKIFLSQTNNSQQLLHSVHCYSQCFLFLSHHILLVTSLSYPHKQDCAQQMFSSQLFRSNFLKSKVHFSPNQVASDLTNKILHGYPYKIDNHLNISPLKVYHTIVLYIPHLVSARLYSTATMHVVSSAETMCS